MPETLDDTDIALQNLRALIAKKTWTTFFSSPEYAAAVALYERAAALDIERAAYVWNKYAAAWDQR